MRSRCSGSLRGLWVYAAGALPLRGQPSQLWHGHEMLYGFVGAAIAGFLLTAVPSWTGARGFAGAPLLLLAALWLAGRLAFAGSAKLPLAVLAICELVFLPGLVVMLAPPLLRARNRNTPLLLVIAGIWISDAVFVYALARGDVMLARTTLLVAIDVVLLLVTVIGGRIVPVFTANALRSRGEEPGILGSRWLDGMVIGAMIVVVVVDAAASWRPVAGAVAGFAAAAQAWRMSRWRSVRTFRDPLLWSLHLAYAWLPVGLALKAAHLLTGAPWAAHWLHALTIGVAASMVLAVMTRAALGHTGRPLVAARMTAVAYVLLGVATMVRVFAPSLAGVEYRWTVITAGVLWIAAFALFLTTYTPMLTRPRVDGRAG